MKKASSQTWIGILMVLSGGALWGVSGAVVQMLFEKYHFQPGWVVNIRLFLSGGLLLLLYKLTHKEQSIFSIFRDRSNIIRIVIFAVCGMIGVQYAFYVAISEGNAATATLLQYLGPIFIVLYVAYRMKRLPFMNEWMALSLAMVGMFLLVTNGNLSGIQTSKSTLIWGLVSAVAAAFNVIYPQRLIEKWGSILTVGWGMLIAGICITPFQQPWNLGDQQFTVKSIFFLLFVIVFGTVCAFVLYLDSLRYLSPTHTGLLGMSDPLCSMIVAVFWLHHQIGGFEYLGAACVVGTVLMLSYLPRNKDTMKKDKIISV
ncbi:drug/metabolite transporter (DMT)-like permease [Croceifilum oryzae]|uniref:Drug/metabolite transporter (DMT)-like permease n=1 Tax=Croceifilum oryzae TaxID=1553429 RepID=A0AAJ1WQ29_9BACL|nr:DMT family transporter [Croceifilum oryzae]MDQ0417117.1 drug/metabolite transporter (DMT)-like permease [Croceifilum oryzae]